MTITKKLFVLVASIISCLTHSILLAEELCEKTTTEEISQFMKTHSDEWYTFLVISSFPPPVEEDSKFVQDRPFQVYTITTESFQHYATQGTFESTLTPTGMWYVPVPATSTLIVVYCQAGGLKIGGSQKSSELAKQINQLDKQVDFALTKHWMVEINPTLRSFLALEKNMETVIYPLVDSFFPSQYAALKTIDSLGGYGGYKASEVLLVIATELLQTANAVDITPELDVHIPRAFQQEPLSFGFPPPAIWVNMKYFPNPENRLLFEVTGYGDVTDYGLN